MVMVVNVSYFFEHISSYEHVLAKRYAFDMGIPGGHIGRGPGAIRALWSAWQALKVIFSAGADTTISLVSVREALLCTYVPIKCRQLFALHEHTT